MKNFNYVITDECGIHARPAGLLVKETKKYTDKITISADDKMADAEKLMAIMAMGIKKGVEVVVTVEGEDEQHTVEELEKFFKETF